jgi:hypothetical protein
MAIVTREDPVSGQEYTYDDSIETATAYNPDGTNGGTTVYSASTGLPISTPTDGSGFSLSDLGTNIGNVLKGSSSAGAAGQLAAIAGLGGLLNSVLGGQSSAYKGYTGGIPSITASRTQYGTPQQQIGTFGATAPTNSPVGAGAPNITPDQLKSYLGTPGLKDSQIVTEMNKYGITPAQMAATTGVDPAAVQSRYNAVMGPNATLGPYRPGQGGITYFSPMQYQSTSSTAAATPTSATPAAATSTAATSAATPPADPATYGGTLAAASGGMMGRGIGSLGSYSDGGHLLKGPGDGVSDSIPATIGGHQPARLADGEFVIPARIVSEIGNGSTEAGARKLYAMMERIKHARSKAKDIAADTKVDKYLPS